MKKLILLTVLMIAFLPTAYAQTMPNFEGELFTGNVEANFVLYEMETGWSIPDFVGNAWWRSSISSDGAAMVLCREMLYFEGKPIGSGGCSYLTWSPSAHAYVELGAPFMDHTPVVIVFIRGISMELIEGQLVIEGGAYQLLEVPYWRWVYRHYNRAPIGDWYTE